MPKYVKKPIVVEGLQWTGYNLDEMSEFAGDNIEMTLTPGVMYAAVWPNPPRKYDLVIKTLEGDMKAKHGDYVLRGVRGEFWAVREDIFLETYVELDDEE